MSPQPSKRKPTPAELKVARQKKIVIVGSVILVILLAFVGPKTFKQLHHSQQNTIPPSMRNAASTTATTAQAAPTGPTQLSDTDVVTVQPGSGQLVSFGLFKSKDPFVQQLASATPAAATTPSAASAVPPQPAASKQTVTIPSVVTTPVQTAPTPTVGTTPRTTVPTPTTSTVVTPTPTPTPTPPPTYTPVPSGSAAISTNGHCEVVPVKGVFPKGDEVFQLVSVASNGQSVKIGVAGGSYQSGASTTTLKKGTALTLVNTADGVRYRLSLLSECPAGSPTASVPETTPTPPATTTTTTTTTPTTAPTSTVTTPTTTTSTTSTTSTTP
jgi:hypothetical protein